MPRIASTWGVIIAAAPPCSTRATSRNPAVGASPQAALVTVNSARPTVNIRRRPYRSPSRPPLIMPTANASPNPATTSWMAAGPACRRPWIDGSATLTMKKSRNVMNVPVSTTSSGAQPNRSRGPAGAATGRSTVRVVIKTPFDPERAQAGTWSRKPRTVRSRPSSVTTATSNPIATGSASAGPRPQVNLACR